MANATVEVIVVKDLLPQLLKRFPGAVDAVLSAGTERTAQYAKTHHPWHNRTGETEASIHSEKTGEHEWSAIAGGAAIFLEHGTVNMDPFPFMQPAADATKPSIDAGMDQLMEHLL